MAVTATALALGSAATTATATTAATAATAGLFGAGGAFSLGATLSTLGTAASLFGVLSAGSAEQEIYEGEARMDEFNAKQEEIRGMEEATLIKKDVARAIASANARGAASGISISSGSPVTAQKEALRDANNALSTSGTNSKIKAETDRVRANISRRKGRNAVRSGQAKAVSILGDFVSDQSERGFSF